MERRVSNDEAYCSILKTVYLFLENNNLSETSESFLREIPQNIAGVNFNDISPRTLILRPCDLNTPAAVAINNDRQVIICITETQDPNATQCTSRLQTDNTTDNITELHKCSCPNAQMERAEYDAENRSTSKKSVISKRPTLNTVRSVSISPSTDANVRKSEKDNISKKSASIAPSTEDAIPSFTYSPSEKDTISQKSASRVASISQKSTSRALSSEKGSIRKESDSIASSIYPTSEKDISRKSTSRRGSPENSAAAISEVSARKDTTSITPSAGNVYPSITQPSAEEDTISKKSPSRGPTEANAKPSSIASSTYPQIDKDIFSRKSTTSSKGSAEYNAPSISVSAKKDSSACPICETDLDGDDKITCPHKDPSVKEEFIPLLKKEVSSNIPDESKSYNSVQPVSTGVISETLREMVRENMVSNEEMVSKQMIADFLPEPDPVISSEISQVLDEMTKENLEHLQQLESEHFKATLDYQQVSKMLEEISEGNLETLPHSPSKEDKEETAQLAKSVSEYSHISSSDKRSFTKSIALAPSSAVTTSAIQSTTSKTSKQSKNASESPKLLKIGEDESELDFTRIKKDLLNADEHRKLKLLQALRWRLTKTTNNIRDHNLVNFIRHDILYLNSPWARSNGQTFFETYFYPLNKQTPHALQEAMARFINTISSLQMGREYLGKNIDIIELIILRVLMDKTDININISDNTREFLIATVQKLSLSRNLRTIMIRSGIVEWLINLLLKTHLTMSNYEAEYAVALLTNLCINAEISLRCEYLTESIGPLLILLLNTPHKCCLPYLIGIFYTFLRNGKINKDLREMGVIATLQEVLKQVKDEEVYKQLYFLINMEPRQESDLNDCCLNNEDTYSFTDYLEDELDENDPSHVQPSGETLLEEYKTSQEGQAAKQVHIIQNQCYNILKNRALHTVEEENPVELIKQTTSSKIRFKPQASTSTSGGRSVKDKNPSTSVSSNLKRTERSAQSQSPQRNTDKPRSRRSSPVQSPERDRFSVSDAEKTYILRNEEKALLTAKRIEDERNKRESYNNQYISENDKDVQHSYPEMPADKSHPSFPHPTALTYYYNTMLDNPNPYVVSKGSKYSCPCYDSILAFLKDEATKEEIPANRGRKSSNVVYGPFKNQVTCNCPSYTNSKEQCNIFESHPKVQRTP